MKSDTSFLSDAIVVQTMAVNFQQSTTRNHHTL